MSSAKLKSPTSKAAGSADGRPKESGRVSSKVLAGARDLPRKVTSAASHDVPHIRLFEHLSIALGNAGEVNLSQARTRLPKMIRSCAEGQVFLIRNGNRHDAPSAVLISVAALERAIRKASKPVSSVTFGEIRASLPFAAMDLEPLQAEPLPYDGLPEAFLPR